MTTFCSVTTPEINSRLALPFKKTPLDSSTEFKDIYTEKKEYVSRVSGSGGGGASYQEKKQQRRSEEFPWPEQHNAAPEGLYFLLN